MFVIFFQDIDNILSVYPTGKYVLSEFEKNKILRPSDREVLIDAVVSYFVNNKINLSRRDFVAISEKIEKRFHDDKVSWKTLYFDYIIVF